MGPQWRDDDSKAILPLIIKDVGNKSNFPIR